MADTLGLTHAPVSVEMNSRRRYHHVTAVDQGLFVDDAVTYLAREAHGPGSIKRPRTPAGPTVPKQIQRARVAPPLPHANLTDCSGA